MSTTLHGGRTMTGQARRSDPATSHTAASLVRPGSARARLLEAHYGHPAGMTDEEAAQAAGLSMSSEYATRCSELMRAGYLRDTNEARTGSSGMARVVREITPYGMAVYRGYDRPEPVRPLFGDPASIRAARGR